MRFRSRNIVLSWLVACGGSTTTSAPPTDASAAATTDAAAPSDGPSPADQDVAPPASDAFAPACDAAASFSTLAGVSLHFPAQPTVFTLAQAAQGISFAYDLVVAAAVPGVVPDPQGSCAPVGPSGLVVHEVIAGAGQSYCDCDQGRCNPSLSPSTAAAGTYGHMVPWDGKNWNGPSDTGNPEGAPFPPGAYTLEVDAKGAASGQPFDVLAQLCFVLTGSSPTMDAAIDAPFDARITPDAAGPACSAPSDCRTFSSYCGGCTCEPLSASAPNPTCDAGTVSCLLDPCSGHSAMCGAAGRCVLQ